MRITKPVFNTSINRSAHEHKTCRPSHSFKIVNPNLITEIIESGYVLHDGDYVLFEGDKITR